MSDNVNLEAADMLLAARDDIGRPNGWCQGDFGAVHELDGAVCAIGALSRQSYVYGYGIAANLRAQAALGMQVGPSVGMWNDRPGRTVEEVMSAMDAAAGDLKGRG